MKGVVLWPKPDRVPLAGPTNTNENPGQNEARMWRAYTSPARPVNARPGFLSRPPRALDAAGAVAYLLPRRGCSSMVEQKLPKLTTRVRFPSPAPNSLTSSYLRPKPSHCAVCAGPSCAHLFHQLRTRHTLRQSHPIQLNNVCFVEYSPFSRDTVLHRRVMVGAFSPDRVSRRQDRPAASGERDDTS